MKAATGSHTGTGTWLVQRATALVLVLLLPGLAIRVLDALPLDFAGWQALFEPLWCRMLVLLGAVAIALHAWVGVRDILMDYIHPTGSRLALYLVAIVTLTGSVLWLTAVLFGASSWSVA